MSNTQMLRVAFTLSCLVPSAIAAQVPADLREAMRARDEAVVKADAATWDRLTADDFTVVLADGTLLTKAERLAQFKTQQAMSPAPAQVEVDDGPCPPGHNIPLPLERSPPASFKRLLGTTLGE